MHRMLQLIFLNKIDGNDSRGNSFINSIFDNIMQKVYLTTHNAGGSRFTW